MILSAFRRRHHNRNIHGLYGAIVAQARLTTFYTRYGVSDSVDGRFELIVLHLVLVLRRLGGEQTAGPTLGSPTQGAPRQGSPRTAGRIGQQLFDVFCRDLNDNLREMGVGDLAVPRKMRTFGEAFYGRQAAYGAALGATDDRELEKALARNIFGLAEADENAARLARYARAAVERMGGEAEDALLAGKVMFPSPEVFADG
jgi:cytochrome b pre-mRNA-processing protein 3